MPKNANATPATPATATESESTATANATGNGTNGTEGIMNTENAPATESTATPAPAKIKAARIDIANIKHACAVLGIKDAAVRALVHKGKLITKTISLPEFGIDSQTVVTPESLAEYKLIQGVKKTRAPRAPKTHTRITFNVLKGNVDALTAFALANGATVHVATPRKAKNTVDGTAPAPVDGTPATAPVASTEGAPAPA